jgi:hypothetical protein
MKVNIINGSVVDVKMKVKLLLTDNRGESILSIKSMDDLSEQAKKLGVVTVTILGPTCDFKEGR